MSWASPVSSTPTSGDSSSASRGFGRDERGIRPTRLPLPTKGTSSAPWVPQIRKRGTSRVKSAPGALVEDFIPWVRPEPNRPSASEEEEEEEEMMGLVDRYTARKPKQQKDANREADRAEGSNLLPKDGGSEMQAILIPASPETGSNVQLGLEEITRGEPWESTPIPPLLQMVLPPSQSEGCSGNAKLVLSGGKRSLPPDRILLNSYLPPRGPALTMEEVIALGPDDVKLILHRWRPFNWGESAADRLDELYPRMIRMPVTSREAELGEKYFVAVLVGTIKEDIQQIVQDGMQIRNCNYVQLVELVKC